jgi:hypothetical protein
MQQLPTPDEYEHASPGQHMPKDGPQDTPGEAQERGETEDIVEYEESTDSEHWPRGSHTRALSATWSPGEQDEEASVHRKSLRECQ